MVDKTKCKMGMEHIPEYHSTIEGKSYWVCWVCGLVEFEFEESHGG